MLGGPGRVDLHAVFVDSPSPMILCAGGVQIVDANSAACRLFRTTVDRLIGRTLSDLVAPELQADGSQALSQAVADGRDPRRRGWCPLVVQTADGTLLRVDVFVHPSYVRDNDLVAFRRRSGSSSICDAPTGRPPREPRRTRDVGSRADHASRTSGRGGRAAVTAGRPDGPAAP